MDNLDFGKILHSRTVWLNVITALVLILASPQVPALFGENTLRFVAAFDAGLNIVMRLITTQPLTKS